MLHLTSARHADLLAPDSEIRELARLLERGLTEAHDGLGVCAR